MTGSFEENLIEYCAPTLAGLKAGSLFNGLRSQFPDIEELVNKWDAQLSVKGIHLRIVADKGRFVLIYCWQQKLLEALLTDQRVSRILSGYGYTGTWEASLERMAQRLQSRSFPHEIGVFLDYPPEDVVDYIRHEGRECLIVGLWKVYHNPEQAEKRMTSFRLCAEELSRHFHQGKTMNQLAVSL